MSYATKTQRVLRSSARWMVASAVILAPWLFGAADPWAFLLIGCIVGVAGLVWLLSQLVGTPSSLFREPLVLLLVLLMAYVGLQAAPLPASLVGLLNPFAGRIHAQTAALFPLVGLGDVMADAGGVGLGCTLSVAPAATRRCLFLLATYVTVFLVMAGSSRHWHQLRHVGVAIVVSGFVMAVVGIVHKFSGSRDILWFHVPRYDSSVFGPFTNRNHFAAHANMIFGVAIGLLLASRHFSDVIWGQPWRDRLAWLWSRDGSRMVLTAFALIVLVGSVCVSLSRGGMLSLAFSIGVLGAVLAFRRDASPQVRSAVLAVSLMVAAAALWFGRGEMLDRLTSLGEVVRNPMEDFRAIVTLDTLRMFGAFPVWGAGFGSFRHIYPVFQTPSLQFRWLHAHNDWAQLLAEGGLVGTVLFLVAVAAWVGLLKKEFPTGRHRARLFVVGLLVGLGALAVHSLVDYSLHKPGNALLMAALAGMTVAGVRLKPSEEVEEDRVATLPSPPRRSYVVLARAATLGAMLLISMVVYAQYREFRGELAFSRLLYIKEVAAAAASPAEDTRAVLQGLRDADLFAEMGRNAPDSQIDVSAVMVTWELDVQLSRGTRVAAADRGVRAAFLAAASAPSDYLAWLALARSMMSMARWDQAELCLQRARELVRHRKEVRMFHVLDLGEELQIP